MNQEDQRIERYRPPRNEDMDRHSNMWKMEQALNEEQQMRRKSFVHEQNIHGVSSDRFYHQAMKSPKHGSIDIALIGSAPFE